MRGKHDPQSAMFFAIDLNDRIRPDHPLRPIKQTVDAELAEMNDRFDAAYARHGRPSVPPERLFKALLLQCLYSLRSERQLVERIDTDLLFRCFAGSWTWTRPRTPSTPQRSRTTVSGWRTMA